MPRLGRGEGPGGAGRSRRCLVTVGLEPTMCADLDLLCISVYCTADDLLPGRPGNARRRLSNAEIVTLCVAQVLSRDPERPSLSACGASAARPLFPCLPSQDALHKRRARLAETIEWLIGLFASQ